MAIEDYSEGTGFSGDVKISELTVITATGKVYDIKPYMMELNIFEDIFSSSLNGNILISDVVGLIEKLPIIGEEYLVVDYETPGFDVKIRKSFRIYKVEERSFYESDRVQTFTLHFCSPEVFIDSIAKIYRSFSGSVEDMAERIYRDYVQTARSFDINRDENGNVLSVAESSDNNELALTTESENQVKFTSNGWGGLKCLNWIASKCISKKTKAADVLFFETNKKHYIASISDIIQNYKEAEIVAADYYMVPKNMRSSIGETIKISGTQYTPPNVAREYKIIQSMNILENFDTLFLTRSGYYASRQIQFDIVNKKYFYNDYDHVEKFKDFPHLHDTPLFTQGQYRAPSQSVSIAYSHPGLYSGAFNNANELVFEINQNRQSLLTGYGAMMRMEISVPGRSDLECGAVVYFQMPEVGSKDQQDQVQDVRNSDNYYTGLYLVSAIRHKITQTTYLQTLELVKDSIQEEYK